MTHHKGVNPVGLALVLRGMGPVLVACLVAVILLALIGFAAIPVMLGLGVLLVIVGKSMKAGAIRRRVREQVPAQDQARALQTRSDHLGRAGQGVPAAPLLGQDDLVHPRARPALPPVPVAPAGWYADGQGSTDERWWDGGQWTAYLRPAPNEDAAPRHE